MTGKELERLRRKLTNVEVIIEKLFGASPCPRSSLKKHIQQLEDLIVELPRNERGARLADLWRNKAVRFWQRYEIDTQHNNNSNHLMVQQPATVATNSPKETSKSTSRLVGPAGDSVVHKVRAAIIHSTESTTPTLEIIRSELKSAFERLVPLQATANAPIEHLDKDVEPLKALLVLLTKARSLTAIHRQNYALLETVFDFAFVKLTDEQRNQFHRICEREGHSKKSLCHLRSYIQFVLINYCEKIANHKKQQQEPSQSKARAKTKCVYCLKTNHSVEQCAQKKARLCEKCATFGHSSARCMRGELIINFKDGHFVGLEPMPSVSGPLNESQETGLKLITDN